MFQLMTYLSMNFCVIYLRPLMACRLLPFWTAIGTSLCLSFSAGNSCFGAVMRSTPLGSRLDCTSWNSCRRMELKTSSDIT